VDYEREGETRSFNPVFPHFTSGIAGLLVAWLSTPHHNLLLDLIGRNSDAKKIWKNSERNARNFALKLLIVTEKCKKTKCNHSFMTSMTMFSLFALK